MTKFFRYDEVSTEDGQPVVYLHGQQVVLDENEITRTSAGITVTGRRISKRIRQIETQAKQSGSRPTTRHVAFTRR